MHRQWIQKMKRSGVTILTPEEVAARALFEQRSTAAHLSVIGSELVRKND